MFLRKAQAFADLMPISRGRGSVYLSASGWWKRGRLTRKWQVASGGRPFSRPRWPLVDIGRSLAKAQRPAQGRTTRWQTTNLSGPGQLFSPTGVHTGQHQTLAEPKALKPGQTLRILASARIFGFVDLRAVNFANFAPISIKRGEPVPIYRAPGHTILIQSRNC